MTLIKLRKVFRMINHKVLDKQQAMKQSDLNGIYLIFI